MSAPATAPTRSTLCDAAISYAARGWRVFPLAAGTKIPIRDTNGFKDASTDRELISDWWRQWPDSNVGIATGTVSDLVVIDVDPRSGGDETLRQLETEHGPLPETVEVLTGGGGRHIFLRHPGGVVPCSAGKLGPGIDVKADGGYIVAPPSIHPDTHREYEWEIEHRPGEVPVASPPTWILEGLTTQIQPVRGTPDRICGGERNKSLTRLAGIMRRPGMTADEILVALLAINEGRCDPPLDVKEVQKIARSVGRYAPASLPQDGPDIPEIETLADLMDCELPPLSWTVDGILPEGLALLIGPPKKGKSLLSGSFGLSVVYSGPVLGRNERHAVKGSVLYGALEDGRRRMKTRAENLITAYRLDRSDPAFRSFYPVYMLPKIGEGLEDFLENWISEHPDTRLIVLDTLGRLRRSRRRGDSCYLADTEDMAPLQRIGLDHHVCILGLHHNNRGEAEDWMSRISGTQAIGGVADTILYLDGSRGEADAVLRVTGRDVPECQLALRREGLAWYEMGDAAECALTRERQEVLRVLREANCLGANGMASGQIAKALGKKPANVTQLLGKMADAGLVTQVAYGRYSLSREQ